MFKDRGEMMFRFLPTKIPKTKVEGLWLILFVAVTYPLVSTGSAIAGCGDYLLHANQKLQIELSDRVTGSMPIDSNHHVPRCAKGECRSAPLPLQHAPTSYQDIRKQACDVCLYFDLVCCVPGEGWSELSDLDPDEPFLELVDPPPRHS